MVQQFKDRILTYKLSLSVAVGAMRLLTTSSIDERTKRIESGLKEDMRHVRCKLQTLDHGYIELASVAGQKGSDWHGTDVGFALSRFLDYAGSLCNSPPPSLNATHHTPT